MPRGTIDRRGREVGRKGEAGWGVRHRQTRHASNTLIHAMKHDTSVMFPSHIHHTLIHSHGVPRKHSHMALIGEKNRRKKQRDLCLV